MTPPLDLAAQITLIYETLGDLPDALDIVEPSLAAALAIGGLYDVTMLQKRRSLGKPIFGQVAATPSATKEEVTALIAKIGTAIAALPTPVAPDQTPIISGPSWTPPTSSTISASVPSTLNSTRYIAV